MILDATRKARLEVLSKSGEFRLRPRAGRERGQGAHVRSRHHHPGGFGKWTQWSRVSTGRIEDVRRYAAALPEVARA